MALKSRQTFSGNKVPKLTKLLFPWSGIFRDMCYALIGTFLLQYAITAGVLSSNASEFKSQYLVITIAMVIALVWDGINDPIMGFILEKVHFKSGKFKPWIALGAVGNAAVVAAMFIIPLLGIKGWGYVVFMIIMYVLWDLCFTINDIGYWSMLPALTNDEGERASLTTKTAIASSIGTFIMTGAMYLLPGLLPLSAKWIYALAGFFVALLFLLSQLAIYFFCQEKERDKEQDEVSAQSSLLDLFRVVIKNKNLLFATLGLFLYYFASYIITGIGANYFYMVFGYGGGRGGMVALIISVVYVLATIFAQAFYPKLIKKMTKKKLLTIMAVVIGLSYLSFLFIAFPIFGDKPLAYNQVSDNIFWSIGGTMFLYYLSSFLFFAGSGIYYLICLVMFQDAIDYNEWKFGERKESICFAWRPLDVKLASGFNRLLQFIVFAVSGTALFINVISNAEGRFNANTQNLDSKEHQVELCEEIIDFDSLYKAKGDVLRVSLTKVENGEINANSKDEIAADLTIIRNQLTAYQTPNNIAKGLLERIEDGVSQEEFNEYHDLLDEVYLARLYSDPNHMVEHSWTYDGKTETVSTTIAQRALIILGRINTNAYDDTKTGEKQTAKSAVNGLYESIRFAETEEARINILRSQKTTMGYIIIGTILVSFAASYICLMFGYKIDEEFEKQIVADLEKKRLIDNGELVSEEVSDGREEVKNE